MYNHEPEKYVCPLCQVAKGQTTEKGSQEEDIIFRDNTVTVFLAGKWWRSNPGHLIIISNEHVENIYDLPEEIGHKISDYSKKSAVLLKKAYKCDGVSTRQHNEPAGSQDVWHFHMHIFPRYENDNLYLNNGDTYWPSQEEKRVYIQRLKENL